MISLRSHSYYTFLQGTISPERLIDYAIENKSEYVSLTDLNGMYGLIQFAKTALEKNIKPVLGCVINDPVDENICVTILAKNNSGYSLLCKLITTRKLKDNFRIFDILKQPTDDIFILSDSIEFLTTARELNKLGENLYVELAITPGSKKQNRELYDFAVQNGIKYCASQPAYFYSKDDYLLHKVVTAIRLNKSVESIGRNELVDEEFYLKTPAEINRLFSKLPEAIENTRNIARQCNVDMKFGDYKFPKFQLPPGETAYSYLWKICFRGLESKYQPISDKVIKRLQYELDVIDELGFCDYFLIVWDIVKEAHRRNMVTIGRGSAANSLVAYCLGLTQVDPIEQNLYFERFLNKGRSSPPDVDLDFSWKERDAIVKYVFEKYGYEKVAMISTTVTFRARSAFRETAKAFGIPDSEISRYSKFIPWTSAKNLPNLASKFPEARNLKFDDEQWKTIIEVASQLGSFPRHLSIHPGGIVITPNPITNYVALEYAKNKGVGLIITQPDMYPIEDFGLIKIDLLSQRSLAVLRDTMNLIKDSETEIQSGRIFKINRENDE